MKKKLMALLLASSVVFSLVGCGEKEYTLGMGIVVEDGSSEGTAQVDATVATVVTDASGKIVSCKLDVAQTKMTIEGGQVQAANEVDTRSKQQKGADYNMKTYGGAIAEWNEQADFFAKSVVGMTVDEVANLATSFNVSGHEVAADEAILAGCTIGVNVFKEAIVKAMKDEYAKSFKASSFNHGLGVSTEVDSSTASASDEAEGAANMYSNFSAVVTDADGKIIVDLIDEIQPKISFDTTGNVTAFNFEGSKKELKKHYGMVAYASAIAEWYQQAGTFEDYIVGKTSAEVTGIATEPKDDHHNIATSADPDLLAGCTISITPLQEIIAIGIADAEPVSK